MTDQPAQPPTGPPDTTPAEPDAKPPIWRRTWFLVVAALVLGLIIGSTSGGGGGDTTTAAPAPTVTATIEGDPLPAETVIVDPLPDVQASLEAIAAELDQRSADLDAREAAITGQEAAVEAGTIPGDGAFLVGTDVQPGTYRSDTPLSGNCYWARLADASGDDIINNSNSAGPSVVEIAASDVAFQSSGCEDWRIVQ